MIVVGVPSKAQVLGSFREISGFESDPAARRFSEKVLRDGYDWNLPDKVIARICEAQGIPYLSLLPVFRQQIGRRIYFNFDAHWTSEGQEIAAIEVGAWIKRHRWLH